MSIDNEIIELENRLRQAQLRSDVDELGLLIDNNLVFSDLSGNIIGKEDDLNFHKNSYFKITKMDVIDRKISCFDNTAVVNVLMDASAIFGQEVRNDRIRYVRVWHKFSEGWRLISGSMRVLAE